MAKKFEESCNTIEKYYKAMYNVKKMSDTFIEKLSNAPIHQDHHLPLPNQFIATDFQIKLPPENLERNNYPYLIKVSCFCCTLLNLLDFFEPKYIISFVTVYSLKRVFKSSFCFFASTKNNINKFLHKTSFTFIIMSNIFSVNLLLLLLIF